MKYKKSSSHILKKIDDKIKFINDNKHLYDVRTLCKCLGIHHSVYYYHCNHQTNSYKIANQKFDVEIKKIYDKSKGRYGSPKITKVLNNKGIKISQKRVARRMKFLGIKSIIIKKYNHAGNSKIDNAKNYPNLLEQDFYANIPSQKWVGDITYIYTKETEWTYLAIVMDLFDLKVVGWYGLSMTESLVIEAFNEAKLAIFEFIESWYNNQRIHSSIGYITPNQKYNNYIANLAIA